MEKMQWNRIIVMSIMSYYARQIFDETKGYEFRKSPLKAQDLDKKIYVYSAKEDKALIGYMKVSEILKGNTTQILKSTGYDVRPDGYEIVDYYGKDFQRCCALKLYDVTEFEEYLTLKDMRRIDPNINLPNIILTFTKMILYMMWLENGMRHLVWMETYVKIQLNKNKRFYEAV